jgi:hypothetical protein
MINRCGKAHPFAKLLPWHGLYSTCVSRCNQQNRLQRLFSAALAGVVAAGALVIGQASAATLESRLDQFFVMRNGTV